MTRKFDRFMVAVDNGHNLKLARLTDAEFRALVQGVWPIAAKANPRGAFMIGSVPATADDVVFMAPKVTRRTAASCLAKLRELGMLEHDDEIGGEWVHDWDTVNPAPKSDRTSADRQAAYRARLKERGLSRTIPADVKDAVIARDNGQCVACGSEKDAEFHHRTPVVDGGGHTIDNLELRCRRCHRGHAGHAPGHAVTNRRVTPPEVEGEVEDPPTPVTGERVAGNIDSARDRLRSADVQAVFEAWQESTGKRRAVLDDKRRRRIQNALRNYPVADLIDAVRGWKLSPHHRGENASGTVYNGLDLLLRDAEHVEKFRDLQRGAGAGGIAAGETSAQRVARLNARLERFEQESAA